MGSGLDGEGVGSEGRLNKATYPIAEASSYSIMKSEGISYSVMSDSFVTLFTVARQAPLSMGFPRQEYWSG